MSEFKYTEGQSAAMSVTDRSLIVSAGAGAGKTSTLVERVFRLIRDNKDGASLSNMLIVTFTRMAAEEMRSRLADRLTRELDRSDLGKVERERLTEELYQLPRAQISTIHSFCLEIIGEFPELAGLTPGFELMSEQEVRLYRTEFVTDKINSILESGEPGAEVLRDIAKRIDIYQGWGRLPSLVIDLFSFLESIPDHRSFLSLIEADEVKDLPVYTLAMQFLEEYIESAIEAYEGIKDYDRSALHPKWAEHYGELANNQVTLKNYLPLSDHSELDGELVEALKLPRSPGVRKDLTDADSVFKAFRENLKVTIDTIRKKLEPFLGQTWEKLMGENVKLAKSLLRDVAVPWYEEYFESHIERRRLTFAHLERLALRVLYRPDGKKTNASDHFQQKFRFVLVDEFQDVNELQHKIITGVVRPETDNLGGNLFVVGDVKQSIYQFRQAEPELFLSLFNRSRSYTKDSDFLGETRIDLADNFRSHPALLRAFNGIFRKLFFTDTVGIDYTDGHEFLPGRDDSERERKPALSFTLLDKEEDTTAVVLGEDETTGESEDEWIGSDVEKEANAVADKIATLGRPWRDICILIRSKAPVDALMDALSRRNIPCFSDSKSGFLTAVEVLEVEAILRSIYNPFDDVALLGLLRGPAARWTESQLLALRDVSRKATLFENLKTMASEETDNGLAAQSVLEKLESWRLESVRLSMGNLFGRLYDDLHLLEGSAVRPGGDQRRLNLLMMQENARVFDGFQRRGLAEFLVFLDDLKNHGEDIAPPSALPEGADLVRIMTYHKSKGMEFDVVFLPFLHKQFMDRDLSKEFLADRKFGLVSRFVDEGEVDKDYRPLSYAGLSHYIKKKQRAEELRLLYVGLTRAKEAVYLYASVKKLDERLTKAIDSQADRPSSLSIINSRSFLDWLLMVFPGMVGMTNLASNFYRNGIIEFNRYETPKVAETKVEEEIKPIPEGLLDDFRVALNRIRHTMSREDDAPLRAKVSVTELKRLFDSTRDPLTPPLEAPGKRKFTKGEAEWFPKDDKGKSGARKGTLTHRFLSLMDLEALSHGHTRLTPERDRLISEGLLEPEAAELIDLPSIQWYFTTDLGSRQRKAYHTMKRELPFTASIDPDPSIPAAKDGPVLLQGVVDLLFKEGDRWILVDYKTDYCGKDNNKIAELVAGYAAQIRLYAYMVQETIGEEIAEAWLVFLSGNHCEKVTLGDSVETQLAKVIESNALLFNSVTPKQTSVVRV